ncbi:MAG: hypothetical protein IT475_06080 [Aquimonas sp.]|nr:hypothetical protein [Aquimonas sp.]
MPHRAQTWHIATNTRGTDYVVGPLLGDRVTLDNALAAVGFRVKSDRLFALGNLIDVGANSMDLLSLLSAPWFHAVCGAREDRLLRIFRNPRKSVEDLLSHHGDGGQWLRRCSPEDLAAIRSQLSRLPAALALGHARGIVGLVHGETPLGLSWQPGHPDSVLAATLSHEHRQRAIHGRRRTYAAIRHRRLGYTEPDTLRYAEGAALCLMGSEQTKHPLTLGNQCILPSLAKSSCVYPLDSLFDTLIELTPTEKRESEAFDLRRPRRTASEPFSVNSVLLSGGD